MLVSLLLFYFIQKKQSKINIQTIAIVSLLLVVYSYVSASRNLSTKFELDTLYVFLVEQNPLFAVMQELGSTQDDIILLIDNCPNKLPFAWGKGVIGALAGLIPGLGNIIGYKDYIDIGAVCNNLFHNILLCQAWS